VKYKGKRTSQDVVFIVFSSLKGIIRKNMLSSHGNKSNNMGAGQIFNFILKYHCTDDFSRQVARYFPATAKVVGTRQIKNLSCTQQYCVDKFDK